MCIPKDEVERSVTFYAVQNASELDVDVDVKVNYGLVKPSLFSLCGLLFNCFYLSRASIMRLKLGCLEGFAVSWLRCEFKADVRVVFRWFY
jgi:hypothetical protein